MTSKAEPDELNINLESSRGRGGEGRWFLDAFSITVKGGEGEGGRAIIRVSSYH